MKPNQQKVIEMLKAGWYISIHFNFSDNTRDISLTDGGNYLSCRNDTLESLIKKGLIVGKPVYSTVQPDTETFEYRLK